MNKRYQIMILLIVLGVAIRFWAPGWIDRAYDAAAYRTPVLFNGCRKAWAHRGFVGEGRENTVGSVRRAIARGASGIEVDILYDVESDRFMISHDRPYQRTNGKTLTLDELFSEIETDTYFWLDAKDLSDLWPWEANNAVSRLASVLEKHDMKHRAFVESRSPFYLAWLTEEGVHTSYMVSPNETDYSAPIFWLNIYFAKLTYTLGPFSALSMNDDRYTHTVEKALGDQVPILVSTVNDRAAFKDFAENPRIRIVLTDEDFFDYDSCVTPLTTQAQPVRR